MSMMATPALTTMEHAMEHLTEQAESFLGLIRLRDPYTGTHSHRVRDLARGVCTLYGLDREDTQAIQMAAQLHDLGKVAIPDEILRKPGFLTDEERQIMQTHSAVGAAALRGIRDLAHLAPMVLHHHEWFDGSGYPSRRAGDRIPFGARVIAAVDAYDALVTERPYRRALSAEEAGDEMIRSKGTQFDPDVVDALMVATGHRSLRAAAHC